MHQSETGLWRFTQKFIVSWNASPRRVLSNAERRWDIVRLRMSNQDFRDVNRPSPLREHLAFSLSMNFGKMRLIVLARCLPKGRPGVRVGHFCCVA